MKIFSSYKVKIKHYSNIFKDTMSVYRDAVDFLIDVCMKEWDDISTIDSSCRRLSYMEKLCHKTKENPEPRYSFDKRFYKFPSYLRRSAINEAIGAVSSYRSRLASWENADASTRGRKPGYPKSGPLSPCMYKDGMYRRLGIYEAKIKVYVRNTWDRLTVSLKKPDADYISRWCSLRKECAPFLRKRGKQWFLEFPFEESVSLNNTDIFHQTVLAVDLGLNSPAAVSVMRSDGTILGRHFLSLPKEYDSLKHSINRIKKVQRSGNFKTPRLWAGAKGINDRIAVLTADFIMGVAKRYQVDTIVFEYLDFSGKRRGSKRQMLHLWKSRYVQSMVTDKAHREGMHIAHVCAWGTSRLAFDGSGPVSRGRDAGLPNHSVCRFQNGKVYNSDLSASYNIGSRYFIRKILKPLPEMVRLALEAKVPQAARRSTSTLSTLISLNAELLSA